MIHNKKIMLLMWQAGGAHLSVSRSLKEFINDNKSSWEVQIINVIKDMCPELDPFYKTFKFSNEDIYNYLIRNRFYGLVKYQLFFGNIFIKKIRHKVLARTREFMMNHKPDYVISAVHHFNGIFAQALHELNIPLGIIPTELMDLEDTPLWFAPEACKHADFFSLALNEMGEQGRRLGGNDNCIITGGLVIKPRFYQQVFRNTTREEAACKTGISPGLFTMLIVMGGSGAKIISKIIRMLDRIDEKIQIVACCGNDINTRKKLERIKNNFKNRIVPLGFTDQMEYYMKAAHILITKPGPTTIWEALVTGTPMIIDATNVIIWEKAQVDFIQKNGLGIVMNNLGDLVKTVTHLKENDCHELKVIRSRMESFQHASAAESIIDRLQRSFS